MLGIRAIPLVRLVAFATLGVLVGCGDSSVGNGSGSGSGDTSKQATIRVLSNRADLISGGDVLVEVLPPQGASATDLRIDVDGRDVSGAFVPNADGRFLGLITNLREGTNVVSARVAGGRASQASITNHPNGGPIFSGPQLQPWTCLNAAATDAQCNQPPTYSYLYKSSNPLSNGFQTYDPNNRPSDVATITTDQGVTVPFIVRIETGYQDRDQYRISALYQPDLPWNGAMPQPQFNHKLLVTHGGSCGVEFQSGEAPSVVPGASLVVPGTMIGLGLDAVEMALGKGFAVMSTSLNNSGHNCNIALQAESLVMAKERVVEQYGELRYTIGQGCSGGSLTVQWVSNAYPGIYQGILPSCSFTDAWSTATQFADYHVLLQYFNNPAKWGLGVLWLPTQMADVEGHVALLNAFVSETAQFHVAVPTDPCAGISDAQRYHPQNNPGGVRCTVQDAAINIFGPRPESLWTDNEKAIGRGFAGFPVDNVGVQYGLKALQQGLILPTQFVDLNEKVGGLDVDTNPIPTRTPAVEPALSNAYRSGSINTASNLDSVPIIDCRGPDPGLFHDAYRAFAIRGRLDRAHGGHENQLIWEGPIPIFGDGNCAMNSFVAMDRWLAAIEQDQSAQPLPQKIIANKPADLKDACFSGVGLKLFDGICDSPVVPVYGTPRTVAGDAITTDTNKCQLKPLDRTDNYGPLGLNDAQWARMQTLFPDGVCDFSKPGVSQQPTIPWQTYQESDGRVIYGGRALPPAPAKSGSGWASSSFSPFQ